jgi:hypothetical protein
MTQNSNPLKQFFRQPAIYLRLPSGGRFWAPGSLELPQNGELPVFPMTAIDEITYRTPDALFNGQATVNVIQSCIPGIKNAWSVPSIDLYSILTSIRIASYGHDLEVASKCPKCTHEENYTVDMREILDSIVPADFDAAIQQGDLEIIFQPMTYQSQTDTGLLQFEQQKTIQVIQNSPDLTDQQKIEKLNEALQNITELTIRALKWSIASIRTPNALVTEPEFIEEFLTNCDRKLFLRIRDHIIALRDKGEVKPLSINCSSCGTSYEQPLSLDQSNFFEAAS